MLDHDHQSITLVSLPVNPLAARIASESAPGRWPTSSSAGRTRLGVELHSLRRTARASCAPCRVGGCWCRRAVAFWKVGHGWLVGYDLLSGERLDPIRADAVISSENGLIHLHRGEDLLEMRYIEGTGLTAVPERIGSVAPYATHLFPGVAIQSLLGSTYASLLPCAGRCVQVRLREIEGSRLLDAKFVGGRGKEGLTGVLVIAVEQAGSIAVHTWSGLHSAGRFEQHTIANDVGAPDLNLVELDTGICISVSDDGTIDFKPGYGKRRTVKDEALARGRLFADHGTLLIALDDGLYRATMKDRGSVMSWAPTSRSIAG